jgi:hypothetical protein
MSTQSIADHLRSLLQDRPPGATRFAHATRAALDAARAHGPEAGDAVAAILQGYAPGDDGGVAERAAHLAYELKLERAGPALVATLERLSEYDPVANAALRALERLREHVMGPLLAAFARCTTRPERARMGTALARAGARDARARAALESMLADDPIQAAGLLAAYGDRDALSRLFAALDNLAPLPPGPGELLRCEEIVAVGQAILALRGKLTPERREKFELAYRRSDELWGVGGPETDELVTAKTALPD